MNRMDSRLLPLLVITRLNVSALRRPPVSALRRPPAEKGWSKFTDEKGVVRRVQANANGFPSEAAERELYENKEYYDVCSWGYDDLAINESRGKQNRGKDTKQKQCKPCLYHGIHPKPWTSY